MTSKSILIVPSRESLMEFFIIQLLERKVTMVLSTAAVSCSGLSRVGGAQSLSTNSKSYVNN
jgi:hypothetical protein